ncbi:MAG: helix-turn-helix domain-containing protein [Lachnospiraceae bacterium]|nr:helix-turn-helix domain-containing protein [Lachnospiraceae bacterium]
MRSRASRKMDVLHCIQSYSEQRGFPPTVRELCVMTGLKSPSSVHNYLVQLKEDGLIESDESKPRTITIK